MKNVTVRLSEEKVNELDDEADELGVSRAEYIRSLIESRHESDEVENELERLQREHEREIDELEREIEHLENQVERLQRTNLKILEERDRTTDLEVYVDERRKWERASWFTRQKWKLFGRE